MKFAERLKFTAAGTSAATITLSAAVAGFRTLAQAIADGALAVGDTGVPFTIDDGANNKETSLFTVTSTTVLTRTSVLASSAGGTTAAAFTGATLSVFSSMPASFASKLPVVETDTPGEAPTIVMAAAAPNNADGRKNNTLYFQTTPVNGVIAMSIKIGGVYVPVGSATPVAGDSSTGYARKVLGVSMPFGEMQTGVLTSNSSWRTVRRFPQAFKRLRCYLFNLDPVNAMTGAKACWSPSESLAGGSRPTIGGAVNNGSSYRFLFGGQLTTTLPAGPGNAIPSITVSDWLDTPSIATTDGNPYPIGYFTTLFTSTARIGYSAPLNPFQSYLEGLTGMKHAFRVHTNNGDCVEDPSLFTQSATSQFCVPMLIEVEYFTGARTLIACGDSTLQGIGNTTSAGAALMALAQLDAAGLPADACVLAETGCSAARQDLRLKNIVANTIPDIIYFQPFSVNDAGSYSGSSAATIARVDYWIAWCAANGVNLILDTPLPIVASGGTAVSGANLTALTDMTTYILSKASSKVKVLDMTSMHSAQYSGVWSATYGLDGYHPKPAGHQVRADLLVAAIKALG